MALHRIRQPQPRAYILLQPLQQRRLPGIAAAAAHHLKCLQQRHARLEQRRQLPAETRRVTFLPRLRPAPVQPPGRPQARNANALALQPGAHIGRAAPADLATDGCATGIGAVPGVTLSRMLHAKGPFLPVRQAWKQLVESLEGRTSLMLTRVVQRR